MSNDEESVTEAPPPCDNDGHCDSADDCTCWVCDVCDEYRTDGTVMYGNGACEDCYDRLVTTCGNCGDPALVDYVSGGDSQALNVWAVSVSTSCGGDACDDCAVLCEECGETWCSDEEASDCCRSSSVVHDYSYRPSLRFWGIGEGGDPVSYFPPRGHTLYLGVEIEAERAEDTADQFLADAGEEAGDERFVYLKHDGSLGSGGVEIVTHPATPQAFLARFPWAALEAWVARGARSYQRPACGMHIHVARSAFTAPHLYRFVRFQLANVEHCIRLAQRESQQWAEWSGDGIDEVKKSLPAMVKGQKSNGRRYVAINFQNRATVELRYFKGNLSPRIIRRQVRFVSAMYEYTKRMTVTDVRDGALDWQRFVDWVAADPMHSMIAGDLRP